MNFAVTPSNTTRQLILGSTSRYRRELLERLNIEILPRVHAKLTGLAQAQKACRLVCEAFEFEL